MPLVYNEFEVYVPSLSSVSLADTAEVGGVMHYYYFITYNFTPVSTQILDYDDKGTNVDLWWTYKTGMTITGGEGFNSATNEQTSMTFYVDTTGGGYMKLKTKNARADTSVSLGEYETSFIYLAPEAPSLTVDSITDPGEAAYRRITAVASTLSSDYQNTKMKVTAHAYDTPGDEQITELGEVEPISQRFTVYDYNVYNTANLYYTAVVTQYNKKGDQDYSFESKEVSVVASPYMRPYPPTLYGTRARRGELKNYLLYKSAEGMQLNWVFNSSDGSSQTQYDCEIRGDVDVSRAGLSSQNCYFSPAEIGGPNIDDAFLVILDTYGAGSIPSQVIDYAYCIADLNLTMTYAYTLLTSTIDISISGPSATVVDSLEFTAHINLKDENGEIVYTATNSSFYSDGHVEFTIDINKIEGYDPDIDYTLDYTVFSNVLEDFSFSGSETLANPTFTRPTEPTVTVEVVDDYCYIDVTTDANAKYIDLICRYADEEFYIAKRAEIADAEAHYRFNTPPVGVEFEIYARAYGDFYMPSDETDGVDGFVPCNSNVYVNYESDEDTTYSKYTEKFAVRVNASFGESIANNLQQYSIIGRYDAVTKLEDNAKREMSLDGEITYGPQDIQLFESFIKTAKKCVIRIPKGNVFYCYISSADLKKEAGSRNAKLGLKLLIDSSIAADQTVTYNACEATLAYVERVLDELLGGE